MKKQKLIRKILSGSKNIRFAEARSAAELFGFELQRITGSHYIFAHPEINEILNLQNVQGKAKPYQIQQLMKLIELYELEIEQSIDKEENQE